MTETRNAWETGNVTIATIACLSLLVLKKVERKSRWISYYYRNGEDLLTNQIQERNIEPTVDKG